MHAASDIADWWDKQHAISKRALDDFVVEYPGLFGVVVATAVATAMEVGKGTVTSCALARALPRAPPAVSPRTHCARCRSSGPSARVRKLSRKSLQRAG
jgi:hypothetical protein